MGGIKGNVHVRGWVMEKFAEDQEISPFSHSQDDGFSFLSGILYNSIVLECTLVGTRATWQWVDQGQVREDLPECSATPKCQPLHQAIVKGEANLFIVR